MTTNGYGTFNDQRKLIMQIYEYQYERRAQGQASTTRS